MIIQICGTNASGKTTAMRKIKAMALTSETLYVDGRKRPFGYDLTFDGVPGKVRLLGTYEEAATGGMDALNGKAEESYDLIKQAHDEVGNVLLEGVRMHNHTRGVGMMRYQIPYHVFLLTTPKEVVMESLAARRAARGAEMLEDTSHVEANMKRAANYAFKMFDSGAIRHKVDRDECPGKVMEVLRHG